MNQLSEKSGFEEEEEEERGETPLPLVALAPPLNVYQLSRCEHMMHQACLRMYMKSKDGVSTCTVIIGSIYMTIVVSVSTIPHSYIRRVGLVEQLKNLHVYSLLQSPRGVVLK